MLPSYPEQPLEHVLKVFDSLVQDGTLAVERAAVGASGPPIHAMHAGPAFVALAARYRRIRLVECDIAFDLHAISLCEDELGGWRISSDPEEIDVRLLPSLPVGGEATGDAILDATEAPGIDDVAIHSTIVHFLVRAAIGNQA